MTRKRSATPAQKVKSSQYAVSLFLIDLAVAAIEEDLKKVLKSERNPLTRRKLSKTVQSDLRKQLRSVRKIGRDIDSAWMTSTRPQPQEKPC